MDRLTNMEAFVRVVEAGSFSRAAQRWGRSKAVVSKYVSMLEEYLDIELLRRSTRSLSLTQAGELYYRRCLALLDELTDLEASLHSEHISPRGRLRITAPPGLMSQYKLPLMTEFRERYPDISMEFTLTHRMVDLVEEGFDVAIRITEPKDSSLVVRKLAPAPLVVAASPAYLQEHGTPEHPQDLRDHACLIDTNFREHSKWRFQRNGKTEVVQVSGPFEVNSPIVVRDLALQAQGIALLPAFVAKDALQQGKLVTLLEGQIALQWSIVAMYPRRRFLSGRVRAYIDYLVEVFQPLREGEVTASSGQTG